jgi:hypothetical protein
MYREESQGQGSGVPHKEISILGYTVEVPLRDADSHGLSAPAVSVRAPDWHKERKDRRLSEKEWRNGYVLIRDTDPICRK